MGKFEIFFTKAIEQFGNKFKYIQSTFKGFSKKILVICPVHGEIWITPINHLKSTHGCYMCYIDNKKSNLEEFIEKARKVHGNMYDYIKSVYVDSVTKLIIICPIHGEFEQTANDHLNGCGCKMCVMLKHKVTLEEFITRSKVIHGNKYDYSKVYFNTLKDKIIIICPVHGEFEQSAIGHLQGYGCSKCWKDNWYLNTETFIAKAKEVHSNRYDYSKTIYIGNNAKLIIICPIHGEFEQNPTSHLKGFGCRACSMITNTTDFIIKSSKVHNNKYIYSNFIFKNSKTKGYVTCEEHGDFLVLPNNHLRGTGCPVCNSSKGELAIKAILEKHNIKYISEYIIPELVNKMRYDFYLPDYNTLIEFHGIQHYKYVLYFHRNGEDDFLAQKNRDDIKKSNARLFKYKLLEFNYTHLKKLNRVQFEELMITKIKL